MKIILIILGIIVGLVLLIWLGMNIQPQPLAPYPGEKGEIVYHPLQEDLPEPVKRFYLEIYGNQVPQIDSVVISGRARMRVNGLTFPGRFRFTHQAGEAYRHYIEATVFGIPLMKINERYLDGISRMELPFGVTEGDPKIDQGANLALWAEGLWFPALFVTDPNARWEAVNDTSAILVVPFEDEEERFDVQFDPETSLLLSMESMRYKGADSPEKILWNNQAQDWGDIDGFFIPVLGAVTWADEGTPWALFTVEELVVNADVSEYIRAVGP